MRSIVMTALTLMLVACTKQMDEAKSKSARLGACTVRAATMVAMVKDGAGACPTVAKLRAEKEIDTTSGADPWGGEYRIDCSGDDPVVISGESGAVSLGALKYIMQHESGADFREEFGLGPDSQVLLIYSEGNTSPDDFRYVVWEGGIPVPEEYKMYSPR